MDSRKQVNADASSIRNRRKKSFFVKKGNIRVRDDDMNSKNGINRERLVRTFTELIEINSPSFEENEIGRVLTGKLEQLGCSVERQDYAESFNLIARKKGTVDCAATLLLCGHMDTIEPTEGIKYVIDDGIIRSVGETVLGSDDKSALAAILEALTAIEERKLPHGDIEVVFTSAEEKGLDGAKNLDTGLIRSRHGLVLDSGGGIGGIVIAAPTHITYKMTLTGKPAHAGLEPEKGISAIRAAARIIAGIPDGRIDENTTANIGIIKGGTATNVVPREVVVNGEMRSHERTSLEKTRQEVFSKAREIAGELQAAIDINEKEEYRSFTIPPGGPFLSFIDGAFVKCGIEPAHIASGGGSDANIFNACGIMTLNLSTGMDKVHSHEERIRVDDLEAISAVVLEAVIGFPAFAKTL